MTGWYWHEEWFKPACDCSPNYCCCSDADRVFAAKLRGTPDMRQVRLVVGEGTDKYQVGVADVQPVPNGDTRVVLTITNARIAEMLGGNQIQGVIPRYVEPLPEPEPESPGEDVSPVPPTQQEPVQEEPTND